MAKNAAVWDEYMWLYDQIAELVPIHQGFLVGHNCARSIDEHLAANNERG